jgi:hypothetical protein
MKGRKVFFAWLYLYCRSLNICNFEKKVTF